MQELEGFLSAQTRDCHVIWTSSVTASRATFDPTDIQGKNRSSFYTILSLCIHVFEERTPFLSKELFLHAIEIGHTDTFFLPVAVEFRRELGKCRVTMKYYVSIVSVQC